VRPGRASPVPVRRSDCHDARVLLAEEFVLLALTPDGRLAHGTLNQPAAAVGVTGALVTELVQEGHVDIDNGRIRRTGTRPANRLLAEVLDNLAAHEGKRLQRRLGSVKHSGWSEVVDAMVAAGVIGRVKDPLRPTRHPVADKPAHARLLAEVRAAATGAGRMEPRIATLLALAGPSQLLEVVAPARSDRAMAKRRIAEAATQVPAAAAVKYVIESMSAVVVVS
jgi:Golgi phosphoprotein 3 (GPP34)